MRSVPGGFWEWMASLQSEERFLLLFISLTALVVIILIVAIMIHSMYRNRLEDSLKRELLDRGMSADEIATIMNKSPDKRASRRSTSN